MSDTTSSKSLSAKYPRMDMEKAARGENVMVLGMPNDEPMLVFRVREGMLQRLPLFQVLDFVVRTNNELYVGNKHWMLAGPANAVDRGGANVVAAGELVRIYEDTIWFNLHSGTYRPDDSSAPLVIQTLLEFKMKVVFQGMLAELPQRK